MDTHQAAWLAGLFEGEGNIAFTGYNSVCIKINMRDQDVVRRCQEVTGAGRLYVVPERPPRQEQLAWQVARRLDVLTILDAIEPYLGERRSARAQEARARLENCRPLGIGVCKRGHPLSGENLYLAPGGQQHCRACQQVRESRRALTRVR